MSYKRYNESEVLFIKQNYENNGPKFCSEFLNRNYDSVVIKANSLGLKISKELKRRHGHFSGSQEKKRRIGAKYMDLKQFNQINTPELSYILGLLWADGNINKYRVSISALKKDMEEVLPFFLKTGEWSYACRHRKRYGVQCQEIMEIKFSHKELCNILSSFDFNTKNFESADRILEKIIPECQHYFYRGLIDGDGCIKFDGKRAGITITSSFEQRWNYLENLCLKLNIKYCIYKDRRINPKSGNLNSRSVFQIHNFYGVKTFLNYIYEKREIDGIGFSRKYEKYLKIKDWMSNFKIVRNMINKHLLLNENK